MDKETEISFSQVLDALLKNEQLPIHLLYRLSDMAEAELDHFDREWLKAEEERRRIIVRHLADLSEDNFVVDFTPVFSRCLRDESITVRAAALDGLWDTTDVSLIEPVIELLHTDESVEVKVAAAATLAHFILLAEWGQLPKIISPPIVEALLAAHDGSPSAHPVRRAALEAVSVSGHLRVETMIFEAYESDDPDMQLSALFAMGGSADSRWLTILTDEMAHPSASMRAEAARALGSIGDESAVADLADLVFDEDRDVALAAVAALGQIGGRLAGDILTELAQDPELEAIHEAMEEALEEIAWLDGFSDRPSFVSDEFPEV